MYLEEIRVVLLENIINYRNRKWVLRMVMLMILDVISVAGAYLSALLLRFDLRWSNLSLELLENYEKFLWPWMIVTVLFFFAGRLYHSIWSQVSVTELEMIIVTYLALLPAYLVILWIGGLLLPRSVYVMGYILNFCLTCANRFSYRFARMVLRKVSPVTGGSGKRVMIIGGGHAGQMIIKEMCAYEKSSGRVCCVIDDNPYKLGRVIEGVPIVGNRHDIVRMSEKYGITHIIFAIPACSLQERTAILNICKETKCKLQIIPGLYQLVNDEVSVTKLRDVEISDLLGREQVQVNNEEILQSITGKVAMVTGGGGSIGSELCRQIAKAKPARLVIFDIYENNAYGIQQELKRKYPDLDLVVLIGSVRNTNRINSVMRTYRPDVVFHAAAHKHVPLMEDSPNEAIKNNVLGTYKTPQNCGPWRWPPGNCGHLSAP